MSKIKNDGLDQYGTEPFEQQQFGTAGVEGLTPPPRNSWSRESGGKLCEIFCSVSVITDTLSVYVNAAGNVFGRVCLSCSRSNCRNPLPINFIFGTQTVKVMFVYQGNRVKVKVTGAKMLCERAHSRVAERQCCSRNTFRV